MNEKKFDIEMLNKFNISIGNSLSMLNDFEGEKINLTRNHLLDALRRMSEYFVESNKPEVKE